MADLIVVCGPQAVGKMTVAESLRDGLHYNMMINHDSIEISNRIFGLTPKEKDEKAYRFGAMQLVESQFPNQGLSLCPLGVETQSFQPLNHQGSLSSSALLFIFFNIVLVILHL